MAKKPAIFEPIEQDKSSDDVVKDTVYRHN